MATCPPGAERKVMLTWENTSLDSKGWERNNWSSLLSIKNSAAECFCEEKKAVATLPLFIPNRGQQDVASLAQTAPFEPPKRATSLLGCEQYCLSALLFGLNANGTKRTWTPKCLPQVNLMCTTPKLLSRNTEPHNHFKQDYNPSKEKQTNTSSWRPDSEELLVLWENYSTQS